MNTIVSLIHGARRFNEPLGVYPYWVNSFKEHFSKEYNIKVVPFIWDGGIKNAFQKKVAADYSRHLEQLQFHHGEKEISIISKSLGGIVVENALNKIQPDVDINTLVRIATPDIRRRLNILNVQKIIDVRSSADLKDKTFKCLVTLVQVCLNGTKSKPNIKETITLDNVKHHEFNLSDKEINYQNYWNVYSLYKDLI